MKTEYPFKSSFNNETPCYCKLSNFPLRKDLNLPPCAHLKKKKKSSMSLIFYQMMVLALLFLNIFCCCGLFLKSLLNLLQNCSCFMFFFFWLQDIWYLNSPTRGQTCTPCIGRQSLNHWTAKDIPSVSFIILTLTDMFSTYHFILISLHFPIYHFLQSC